MFSIPDIYIDPKLLDFFDAYNRAQDVLRYKEGLSRTVLPYNKPITLDSICRVLYMGIIIDVCRDFASKTAVFDVFIRHKSAVERFYYIYNYDTKDHTEYPSSSFSKISSLSYRHNRMNYNFKFQASTQLGDTENRIFLLSHFMPITGKMWEEIDFVCNEWVHKVTTKHEFALSAWYGLKNLFLGTLYLFAPLLSLPHLGIKYNPSDSAMIHDVVSLFYNPLYPYECLEIQIDPGDLYKQWCLENQDLCCHCGFHDDDPDCPDYYLDRIFWWYPAYPIWFEHENYTWYGHALYDAVTGQPLELPCWLSTCDNPGRFSLPPGKCFSP